MVIFPTMPARQRRTLSGRRVRGKESDLTCLLEEEGMPAVCIICVCWKKVTVWFVAFSSMRQRRRKRRQREGRRGKEGEKRHEAVRRL